MVDVPTNVTMTNGFRNIVLRVSLVSDGSGLTNYKVYDATSTGTFGVMKQGQTFYPGIHSKILGLDYDVQDLKLRIQWEATTNQDVIVLGNAPEDYDWRRFGGLPCPPGLTGATGSLLITTFNQAPQSTFNLVIYLAKCVPQS